MTIITPNMEQMATNFFSNNVSRVHQLDFDKWFTLFKTKKKKRYKIIDYIYGTYLEVLAFVVFIELFDVFMYEIVSVTCIDMITVSIEI